MRGKKKKGKKKTVNHSTIGGLVKMFIFMNGIEDTTAKQVFSDNINTNTSNICIFSSVMKHKCLELGKVVLFVRMPL